MPHSMTTAPGGVWFRPSVRNVPARPAPKPATPAVPSSPSASPRPTVLERIDRWFWRQEQRRVEAYLARSVDVADLEMRIRALDRRPSPGF